MSLCVRLPNAYSVTDSGDVLSPKGRKLKPYRVVNGRYWMVKMGRQAQYVHRLVATCFIPNPDRKPQVGHVDGDGLNNHVSNLHWVTQAENEADKKQHLRDNSGMRNGQSKVSTEQVEEIRSRRNKGEKVKHLASEFGVSTWAVYDLCNPKRTWRTS